MIRTQACSWTLIARGTTSTPYTQGGTRRHAKNSDSQTLFLEKSDVIQ